MRHLRWHQPNGPTILSIPKHRSYIINHSMTSIRKFPTGAPNLTARFACSKKFCHTVRYWPLPLVVICIRF